eukprot:714387_1
MRKAASVGFWEKIIQDMMVSHTKTKKRISGTYYEDDLYSANEAYYHNYETSTKREREYYNDNNRKKRTRNSGLRLSGQRRSKKKGQAKKGRGQKAEKKKKQTSGNTTYQSNESKNKGGMHWRTR